MNSMLPILLNKYQPRRGMKNGSAVNIPVEPLNCWFDVYLPNKGV